MSNTIYVPIEHLDNKINLINYVFNEMNLGVIRGIAWLFVNFLLLILSSTNRKLKKIDFSIAYKNSVDLSYYLFRWQIMIYMLNTVLHNMSFTGKLWQIKFENDYEIFVGITENLFLNFSSEQRQNFMNRVKLDETKYPVISEFNQVYEELLEMPNIAESIKTARTLIDSGEAENQDWRKIIDEI